MSTKPSSMSFMYVETDIPPGMTIPDWRAQRAAEQADRRRAERAASLRLARIGCCSPRWRAASAGRYRLAGPARAGRRVRA
jgi:hypothetical protein